jgi:serine/threonine protein kinase
MTLNIPDYEIDSELGSGGMASVYRARHRRLHRLVALKVMHPELNIRDNDFSERFLREARIAADLTHPNIVQVYDVNLHGKNHFIAMEYVNGGDLKERLKTPVDRDELISIIGNITSGLDYAHSRGYIHRDIKPANILFRESGEAVVSDFGIARAIDSNTHLTITGSVIGTPTYMSPEQASGATIDGRSDLYSVAVIVFEILTGTVPYVGETSLSIAIKHISDPIPTLPEALRAVQPFINRGMAKDPNDRFNNGLELIEMLQDALDHLSEEDVKATTTLLLVKPGEKNKKSGQTTAVRKSNATTMGDNRKTLPQLEKLKPHRPAIIAGVVVVILLIFGGIWLNNKAEINNNQKIQLQQLLTAAQADINAGRLYLPANTNALSKYQTAKAIATDFPDTVTAIDSFNALLLQKSDNALSEDNWNLAEEYSRQVLKLSPDDTVALEQIKKIEELRQLKQAELQTQFTMARQATIDEQWPQAIELYSQIKSQHGRSIELEEQLTSLITSLIDNSADEVNKKQYKQAKQLLEYAELGANLSNGKTNLSAIKTAQANIYRKESLDKQQGKIQTLLSQAKATNSAEKAAKLYQQVVNLDPNNTTAKAGVNRNANTLLQQTEKAIYSTDLTTANRNLSLLGSSIPLTENQSRRKNELRSLLKSTAAQQTDLVKLFDRFERYMEIPKVASADKIFRRIEKINYNHPRLPALRQELADGYMVLAQREAQAEDWDDAISLSNRGLEHVPAHSQLQALLANAIEKNKTSNKKLLNFFR